MNLYRLSICVGPLVLLTMPAKVLSQQQNDTPPTKLNLAEKIDPQRDVIRGKVVAGESILRVEGGDALVRIPVRIEGDYKVSARVRRVSGNQQVVVIIPVGERHACVVLDWNTDDKHGLETIDGLNVGAAGLFKEFPFVTGRWYDLDVIVKTDQGNAVIESNVGEITLFHWQGKLASLSLWEKWALPETRSIGLGNWDSDRGMVAEFSKLELTMLRGTIDDLDSDRAAVTGSRPGSQNPAPAVVTNEPMRPATPPPVVRVPPSGSDWQVYRGPGRLGISGDRGLPTSWGDDQNIVWKTRLPGPGTSSPIVWGDRIYVTCYSGYGESETAPGNPNGLKRHLVCADRNSGRILWTADADNRARVAPYQGVLALHGYASSSPAADESGVYVFYGSSGAAAYTHEGKLRWQRSLGTGTHGWGTSASPVLFDDLAIFHADIEGQGLVALNKENGQLVWNVETGSGDSWSTPCLAQVDGRNELIFHHSKGHPHARIMAVNPGNGELLWECNALKDYLAPSPIVVGNTCYAIGYARSAAIRLGGSGNVTETHLQWTGHKGSEICTPLYHDGHLYWAHQESGIAYCLDVATGRMVYEERIQPSPGKIYASGVLADGKIYYVSRERGVYVVAAAPQYRLLEHNTIASDDSVFNATPAISRGRLILRSRKFLYCIGEP